MIDVKSLEEVRMTVVPAVGGERDNGVEVFTVRILPGNGGIYIGADPVWERRGVTKEFADSILSCVNDLMKRWTSSRKIWV